MELDAWSYADEEWRGFVLIDSRDELLDRHVFVTLVAGESFYPEALGHADFAPGSPLVLRHEPDNPFDPNAMGIWNADETLKVGHVPAIIVRNLTPFDRSGIVVGVMLEGSAPSELMIAVAREPLTLRVIDELGERPRQVELWLRQQKLARRRSEEQREFRAGDPMEQMRRMAEDLRRPEVT
jgi:HIRAN domain